MSFSQPPIIRERAIAFVSQQTILPGHSKTEEQHRNEACIAWDHLHALAYVVAYEGSISVRLDDKSILITPPCQDKGVISPHDLRISGLDSPTLIDDHLPSSCLAMHIMVYRNRPDVNSVCHAYPPVATGFGMAGRELNQALLLSQILGQIPLVQYFMLGTPELVVTLEPHIQNHDALLLANQGALTCGPDLLTTLCRMEVVERCARITIAAELAGCLSRLFRRN